MDNVVRPTCFHSAAPNSEERVASQETVAVGNGFAPARDLHAYAHFTGATASDIAKFKQSQADHDEKPSAREVAASLAETIRAEDRQDLGPFGPEEMRMHADGRIVHPRGSLIPNHTGFRRLVTRAIPATGAPTYLEACSPRLRAINFNNWMLDLTNAVSDKEMSVKLRTRNCSGGRELFSAVSEKYTPFDGDIVGEALQQAFPEDARGALNYDGNRYRIEGLWRTDVCPSEFDQGEVFKAGVIIRSDDTGGGSIKVQSVIWRNLCKNLLILDKSIGVDISLRHVGSTKRLSRQFSDAFGKSLNSVEGFRKAWGCATQDYHTDAELPGYFNGILQNDFPLSRGRGDETIGKLVELHWNDEAFGPGRTQVSRASIINTFTRYAHKVETDPFKADVIREAAGKLLTFGRNGQLKPLPYISLAS